MKIVIVTDKEDTAIDRIAQMIQSRLLHFDIVICRIHPKRPDAMQLGFFANEIKDADILDVEYWKSGEVILDKVPDGIKKIVAHHNPYDTQAADWSRYDIVLAKNKEINEAIPGSQYIKIPVDLSFFKYNREYNFDSKNVLMVANRIESKKGVLEVAIACSELGYPMHLVGAISDREYFNEVMKYNVTFHEHISNEELRDLYYASAVHVCNSADNFESGTMPILEAMATGCPVITRPVGHVPDFYDRTNVQVRYGAKEDIFELKETIRSVVEDKEKRKSLRDHAIKTVRAYSAGRMAYEYEKLYYKTVYPLNELVSIIVPTHNRQQNLGPIVKSIEENTYKAVEVVFVDDHSVDDTEFMVDSLRSMSRLPIKYVRLHQEGYNLGLARNMGAVASCGDILMFLDDRYVLNEDAIENLISKVDDRSFTYGIKDGVIKGFVENFAAIKRQTFFDRGMFAVGFPYGFLSQETRARFSRSGIELVRVEAAKASSISKSRSRNAKIDEIAESKDLLNRMGYGKY